MVHYRISSKFELFKFISSLALLFGPYVVVVVDDNDVAIVAQPSSAFSSIHRALAEHDVSLPGQQILIGSTSDLALSAPCKCSTILSANSIHVPGA